MLETPDAEPTRLAGTHAVDADEEGPFDMPIPTAIAASGRTNAPYRQSALTKPTAANPTVVMRNPTAITWRPPSFAARRGREGDGHEAGGGGQCGEAGLERGEPGRRILEVQADQCTSGR